MSFVRRIRDWWNRDTLTRAEEETAMTPHERDVDKEDFESRNVDVAAERYAGIEGVDFESDSEPPRHP